MNGGARAAGGPTSDYTRTTGGIVVTCPPYNAKGDGITDDTSAITSAIAAAATTAGGTGPAVSGGLVFPPGTYVLTSTINIHAVRSFRMVGIGAPTSDFNSVVFKWNGPNGGTVFHLDHVHDSEFGTFSLIEGTGTIGVGLDIDNSNPATPWITTHDYFHHINVVGGSALVAGFRLSNTAVANNELHTFEDVQVTGASNVGSGIQIKQTQSKEHRILRSSFNTLNRGIEVNPSGSFSAWGTNFSGNTTDILLFNPADTILIDGAQSESANSFLTASSFNPSAWAVTIIGSRLDTNNVGANNLYINYRKGGPLNLIGNDFASGVARASVTFQVNGEDGTPFNSIGNIYPNSTPFVTGGGVALQSLGDVYISGGNAVPLGSQTTLGQATTNRPAINVMSGKWNNAGTTFTGIFFDVLDTNSAAGSLLMDLNKNGASQFSVSKNGLATAAAGVTAGTRLVSAAVALTYGPSVAINASLGNNFTLTATDGVAFTVANPTGAATGQRVTVTIRNTSGGGLGVVTWGTLYKLAAWTSPATAFSRSITFVFDGTNWVESGRTTEDVPN